MLPLLKNLMRTATKQPVTRRYPFETRAPFQGTRGMIDMDPNACTYCMLCAKRCPANALTVTRKPEPNSWTLDPHKCILCNYCVEVCPKKCIVMHPFHRAPTA
jgi:ech hydrogenase subunit F